MSVKLAFGISVIKGQGWTAALGKRGAGIGLVLQVNVVDLISQVLDRSYSWDSRSHPGP